MRSHCGTQTHTPDQEADYSFVLSFHVMFGGRGLRQKGARWDGPVAIPREDRLQLRVPTGDSDELANTIGNTVASSVEVAEHADDSYSQKVRIPSLKDASRSEAWSGQTLEYAAGVYLRKFVLEPVIRYRRNARTPDEAARQLSCYARGQLLFLKSSSGIVQMGSIAHVVSKDGPTLAAWWEHDNVLPYAEAQEWSNWWVERCHFFDPGCEMIKLLGGNGDILGVAYFERSLMDKYSEGKRITLIRGIRICPRLNPESLRRSKLDRKQPVDSVIYPGIPSILLFHIIYASLRFGVQGVAINCPKEDSVEDFYEHYLGLPHHIDPVTGRRFYRLNDRFEALQMAFREQLDLVLEYKDQMEMDNNEEEDIAYTVEGDHPEHHSKSGECPENELKSTDTEVLIIDVGGCSHEPTNSAGREQDVEILKNSNEMAPQIEADDANLTCDEINEQSCSERLSKRSIVDVKDAATNSGSEIKKLKSDGDAMSMKESIRAGEESKSTCSDRGSEHAYESEQSDAASEAGGIFEDAE